MPQKPQEEREAGEQREEHEREAHRVGASSFDAVVEGEPVEVFPVVTR
jgi:hypothetical protein